MTLLAPVPLEPLERGQINVMRLRAAGVAAVLLVPVIVLDVLAQQRLDTPLGLLIAPMALLKLWLVTLGAKRRWKHWCWHFSGRELHVAHGWWSRSYTVVPVSRVQHIDVTQGPIERSFGVARLILHTAGTAFAIVVLPGISRETAEEIRDAIRRQVSGEPW